MGLASAGKLHADDREEFLGDQKSLSAEYLVCALPMGKLRDIPVTPAWPEAKAHVIRNVVFSTQARVIFQCRTPFWKGDLPSANVVFAETGLHDIWESAEEVAADRALLLGVARPEGTAAEALAVLNQRYPGRQRPTVEQTLVHNWIQDPWSSWCERLPFPLGQFRKFWPPAFDDDIDPVADVEVDLSVDQRQLHLIRRL
jgi:monoamine oxidase